MLLLLTIVLTGCTLRAPQPQVQAAMAAAPVDQAGSIVQAAPNQAEPISQAEPIQPAAPALGGGPEQALPALDALPAPTSAFASSPTPPPDPLKFTFPTAAADAISLWRAPLYPVPWEPTPNDHFYFTRPIGADSTNWPLARYRYGYILYSEPHSGIDIPSPKGTPILAAGPGTVIWAGYGLYFQRNIEEDPYGIAVAIQHDFGYKGKALYTVYGHMDETYVYRGQHVESGDALGVVGETGKTSGPHLHFEVRVGDETFFTIRNPELWISPPQGTGVLAAKLMSGRKKAVGVRVALRSTEGKGNFDVLSYAGTDVNCDEYYNENLVLGDVPAGRYTLIIDRDGVVTRTSITILAGRVNYFTQNANGEPVFGPPPAPSGFIAPDATATSPTP